MNDLPNAVSEIVGEVQKGYWEPASFEEWKQIQISTAIVTAWKEQQNSERYLRKRVANWIFGLISLQVVLVFSIIFFLGLDLISLEVSMVKVMLPTVLAEVFGMGLIVVKYLFNNSAQNIDKLIEELRGK